MGMIFSFVDMDGIHLRVHRKSWSELENELYSDGFRYMTARVDGYEYGNTGRIMPL